MSATASQLAPPPTPNFPRLLALIKDSDSVELKLTVPDGQQRSAVHALGLDPLDAQIRQVFFFDTPELALFNSGLVVRARRVQKRGDDSVVKLRPVVPSELPDGVRHAEAFNVEVDAMPGGFVCSGSMKAALGTGNPVREALAGAPPAAQALHEGAARPPRRPRARRADRRRPRRDGADLRPQAQVRCPRSSTAAGRRDVALPGQLDAARAVDQVPARQRRSTSRPPPARTSPSAAST